MPFTLRNLREDLDDLGSNFDGAPDLELRLATAALGLERSGLGYQRLPPGHRFPYGHTHREQEEVYVVVGGGGRMKLDEEVVELRRWDAVRVGLVGRVDGRVARLDVENRRAAPLRGQRATTAGPRH